MRYQRARGGGSGGGRRRTLYLSCLGALGAEGDLPILKRFAEEIGKRAEALCEVESADAGILLSRLQHGIIPRSMLNITWFAKQHSHCRTGSSKQPRQTIMCDMTRRGVRDNNTLERTADAHAGNLDLLWPPAIPAS